MRAVLNDGFALAIFHSEIRSQAIRRLVRAFDCIWNGDGSVTSVVHSTPPGVAPFPPYAHFNDKIVIQLYGKQRVQLFYPRDLDQSVSAVDPTQATAYPFTGRGPMPVIVHQVESLVLPLEGKDMYAPVALQSASN